MYSLAIGSLVTNSNIYTKRKNEVSFKNRLPRGLDGKILYVPYQCKIKPRCLGLAHYYDHFHNINTEYRERLNKGELLNIFDCKLMKFFNFVSPQTLQQYHKPIKKSLHLSAFNTLSGTLGASSEFGDKILSTDGLFECAALAIVDTKQQLQSLLHCYAWENKYDLTRILNYITRHSNPNDLEFFFVPGCRKETANTISAINDILKKKCPQAEFNYMNYPNYYKQSGDTALVLQNGELKFCNTNMIQNKRVNPFNEIIYFDFG